MTKTHISPSTRSFKKFHLSPFLIIHILLIIFLTETTSNTNKNMCHNNHKHIGENQSLQSEIIVKRQLNEINILEEINKYNVKYYFNTTKIETTTITQTSETILVTDIAQKRVVKLNEKVGDDSFEDVIEGPIIENITVIPELTLTTQGVKEDFRVEGEKSFILSKPNEGGRVVKTKVSNQKDLTKLFIRSQPNLTPTTSGNVKTSFLSINSTPAYTQTLHSITVSKSSQTSSPKQIYKTLILQTLTTPGIVKTFPSPINSTRAHTTTSSVDSLYTTLVTEVTTTSGNVNTSTLSPNLTQSSQTSYPEPTYKLLATDIPLENKVIPISNLKKIFNNTHTFKTVISKPEPIFDPKTTQSPQNITQKPSSKIFLSKNLKIPEVSTIDLDYISDEIQNDTIDKVRVGFEGAQKYLLNKEASNVQIQNNNKSQQRGFEGSQKITLSIHYDPLATNFTAYTPRSVSGKYFLSGLHDVEKNVTKSGRRYHERKRPSMIGFEQTTRRDVNVVSLLGLFELSTQNGERPEGWSELEAAKLAVRHINKEGKLLPGYTLELLTNDTKVSVQNQLLSSSIAYKQHG